jgi:hypothetical protein
MSISAPSFGLDSGVASWAETATAGAPMPAIMAREVESGALLPRCGDCESNQRLAER